MKVGDLVKYNFPERSHPTHLDTIIGIIIGDSYTAKNGTHWENHRMVFWSDKKDVYPINMKNLEVVSESR